MMSCYTRSQNTWLLLFTSFFFFFTSVHSLSRVWLCDPIDCSTPGLPVHNQFPEFTPTHVHWVGDAIQPSHLLSSPSPAFNLSQHQGLFQWASSSHQVAKVLAFQLHHQSFQWIFRTDFLYDGLVISLQSKGLSRVFSNTTVQKHQLFGSSQKLHETCWHSFQNVFFLYKRTSASFLWSKYILRVTLKSFAIFVFWFFL